MGDAGFFKGTSADQDARFSDKQKKLLRSMHFPSEFNQKIDMKKVNLKVIKGWMAQRISQYLGIEDEVVVEYASGMLEEDSPDPKMMQINLQGFLERNSQAFVLELWKLLISAQKSLGGIPQQFLDQTKEELLQAKRLKDAEMGKLREQEDKERAVADEVRRKAQTIRDANRPKASSLGNNDTANSRTTLQNGPREDHQVSGTNRGSRRDRFNGGSSSRDGADRDGRRHHDDARESGNNNGSRGYDRNRDRSRERDRGRDSDRDRYRDRRDTYREDDHHAKSSRRRSRSRSYSRERDGGRIRERRSHRDSHRGRDRSSDRGRDRSRDRGRDRSRDRGRDQESDQQSDRHREETKRRRVRSSSRSRSGSRKAHSGERSLKNDGGSTAKSRSQSPASANANPETRGQSQDPRSADIDTVALERQLREKLLRERVLQSVKNKQTS